MGGRRCTPENPQFPVLDALKRATAATSRQPESDGFQVKDSVSVVGLHGDQVGHPERRKANSCQGRCYSVSVDFPVGLWADECSSGALSNGRNPWIKS